MEDTRGTRGLLPGSRKGNILAFVVACAQWPFLRSSPRVIVLEGQQKGQFARLSVGSRSVLRRTCFFACSFCLLSSLCALLCFVLRLSVPVSVLHRALVSFQPALLCSANTEGDSAKAVPGVERSAPDGRDFQGTLTSLSKSAHCKE